MTKPTEAFTNSPADESSLASQASVTIVVPAYNEEGGIEGVVRRLAGLELGLKEMEILVVDDGSTDATGSLLQELAAEIAALQVLVKPRNEGYGAALLTGFAAAKHEVVVITDADGTYPEDRIRELVELVEDHLG